MKVKSFIKHGIEWCPVEIEISFLPGLPQFQFLGLPDTALRESQWRIKSAIKQQGFQWPRGKQIIVNMRPQHIRKSSQGLEFAITCAFLWATGQVSKSPLLPEVPWVYGEVGLQGEVYAPEDIFRAESELEGEILLTGKSDLPYPFTVATIPDLKSLESIDVETVNKKHWQEAEEVSVPLYSFCAVSAKLLQIIAVGEHSTLLVGPAGSGKTTISESLAFLIKPLNEEEKVEVRKWALAMNWPLQSRPFVMPHHSTPNISMIGGGHPPVPGEITRAHRGILVLDELLEFSSVVKESLREPIVSGKISVSRRGVKKEYPADFLLIATSNLCHCGHLVPGKFMGCRFSIHKCRSYTERLSGPLADRFQILTYSHEWKKSTDMTLVEIKQRVQQAQEFSLKTRKQKKPNSKLKTEEVEKTFNHFLRHGGMPELKGSRRRHQAVLQVARTLADLEAKEEIHITHINEALAYTVHSFAKLQQIFA
ncbi:MAG: ATP-binding protein [Bdellovibrionaceae bacterium]|nr:ATP-binding protein [Pseudobdellovibrionaceae bacterium]